MATPFLLERRTLASPRLHLLPTANVVMTILDGSAGPTTRFVFPHKTVIVLDDVIECAGLTPNLIKCTVGEPRRFLGSQIDAGAHPMLSPFSDLTSVTDAVDILEDLRGSLLVTPDEEDFLSLWAAFTAGDPLVTNDRRVQRLCLRFAGQAPKTISMVHRLARTLDADNSSGLYNGLGEFADASHFGRVCRAFTGRTPSAWRNMSQTF